MGLRWEDVDLDAARLRVERALQELAEGLVSGVPKTEESRRTLVLPSFAVTALRAHRVHQIQERLVAGSRWKDGGLVFTTTIGTPIHPRNFRTHLREALECVFRANVNKLGLLVARRRRRKEARRSFARQKPGLD